MFFFVVEVNHTMFRYMRVNVVGYGYLITLLDMVIKLAMQSNKKPCVLQETIFIGSGHNFSTKLLSFIPMSYQECFNISLNSSLKFYNDNNTNLERNINLQNTSLCMYGLCTCT